MIAVKLTYNDLAALLHAISETPGIERPATSTVRKIAAAYVAEGGDPADYPGVLTPDRRRDHGLAVHGDLNEAGGPA